MNPLLRIRVSADYQKVKPQSEAYGKYADAHVAWRLGLESDYQSRAR